MEQFKGTKGKWKLANNEYGYYTSVRNLDDTRKVCVSRVNNQIESNANMVLIAHAPELLEKLKECRVMFNKKKWLTTTDMSIMIDEINELLTRATTI